jgi:hypothetical protein
MFVVLVIQHAKRMRRIILSSVASLALPHCSTLSHKRYDFRGKGTLLNTKRVLLVFLQFMYETFLTLRRIQRDTVINVLTSSRKVPVILIGFWWNLHFPDRFSNGTQISDFVKIRPMGSELFHADMAKVIVTFRHFAKTPKIIMQHWRNENDKRSSRKPNPYPTTTVSTTDSTLDWSGNEAGPPL